MEEASVNNNKRKPQVLIVDDQLGVRMMLAEAFKNEDFEVNTSADGEEALALVKTSNPGIIFLDMKMPKMDGIFVFSELRKLGYEGPIVIMTGMEKGDVDLDVDYILSKPFNIDEAIDLLHQLGTREEKLLS